MSEQEPNDYAWLRGWRAHQEGKPCEHGYGPGDHHWETGLCAGRAQYPETAPPAVSRAGVVARGEG